MEIIEQELKKPLPKDRADVIKRVIHTTADFEYVDSLCFSDHVVEHAVEVLKKGAIIVTDTNMGKSGINKSALNACGCQAECFMADEDVAKEAKERGVTRASVSMEKAADIQKPLIFAIGNAPTALMTLYDLIKMGRLKPELIIGVPVGFVNVTESKELIMTAGCPYIVARGRKGGSNVAAAICNSLLYQITRKKDK